MARRPSFQFYPGDWLSSSKTAMMTPAEEGAYIRLLCYCWKDEDCSLPDDDEVLARLSRLNEGWLKGGSRVVASCFQPHPTKVGFLTNERLMQEREKQDEWRRKSAAGGRKSAATRAKNKSKGGSHLVATKAQPIANTSSSSSSSNNTSKNKFSDIDMELAKFFYELISKNIENPKKPSFNSWANDIRLMREQDKREPSDIRGLMVWVQADDFWKSNVMSTKSLRKSWDRLMMKRKSTGDIPDDGWRDEPTRQLP